MSGDHKHTKNSGLPSVNGLVELLPLDNLGTMLALERSFSVGAEGGGNDAGVSRVEVRRQRRRLP